MSFIKEFKVVIYNFVGYVFIIHCFLLPIDYSLSANKIEIASFLALNKNSV